MTSLTDFLLARISEDEEAATHTANYLPDGARSVQWQWNLQYRPADRPKSMPKNSRFVSGCPTPARVLAECESKRRIVGIHKCEHYIGMGSLPPELRQPVDMCSECAWSNRGESTWPCETLLLLASVYRAHPDYNEAWTTA